MDLQDLTYKIVKPKPILSEFIESYWMLINQSDVDREIIVLPDGRVDLFFSLSAEEPFHVSLLGIETMPSQVTFKAKTRIFAVSLKLLAIEQIFGSGIANLLNVGQYLPVDFWGLNGADLENFEEFCTKMDQHLTDLFSKVELDPRKQKLFNLIYSSNGAMTVTELAEQSYWSRRQINRYFNQNFGLSLKAYCNILRFRASFPQIREGKFFPEQNFTDQAHFIKEIKRFSGVIPKELNKNKNGRFIQFSVLPKK